jgi:hypothetical protein
MTQKLTKLTGSALARVRGNLHPGEEAHQTATGELVTVRVTRRTGHDDDAFFARFVLDGRHIDEDGNDHESGHVLPPHVHQVFLAALMPPPYGTLTLEDELAKLREFADVRWHAHLAIHRVIAAQIPDERPMPPKKKRNV